MVRRPAAPHEVQPDGQRRPAFTALAQAGPTHLTCPTHLTGAPQRNRRGFRPGSSWAQGPTQYPPVLACAPPLPLPPEPLARPGPGLMVASGLPELRLSSTTIFAGPGVRTRRTGKLPSWQLGRVVDTAGAPSSLTNVLERLRKPPTSRGPGAAGPPLLRRAAPWSAAGPLSVFRRPNVVLRRPAGIAACAVDGRYR